MTKHPPSRQVLLIGGVVATAAIVVVVLFLTRPPPPKSAEPPDGVLVATSTVQAEETAFTVRGQGSVRPVRSVELVSEITGRIVEVAPELRPGGTVSKGAVLVRIESADYELAAKQAHSALTQARAELELEQGRVEVARGEWEFFENRFSGDTPQADRSLALRQPQLSAAHARVAEAEAQLRQAELNLSRTEIAAPFDARVRDESAAIGQLAAPSTPIATLVDRDKVWIEAALPVGDLPFVGLPDEHGKGGSSARVTWDTGPSEATYSARVIELLPALSAQGRMARVLLEADQDTSETSRIPLLQNAYVDVAIKSPKFRHVVRIPRGAVHNGREVYVFDDGTLRIARPEIAWRTEDDVLATEGISAGTRVVTTPLAAPVAGMPLRLEEPVGGGKESDTVADSRRRADTPRTP